MNEASHISPLNSLAPEHFESPRLLKKLTSASRCLAEFKGVAASIPNQGILINTLGLQEAKDSSAIENIVTTHDDLYGTAADLKAPFNPAAKEVLRYANALHAGFAQVRRSGLLTINMLGDVQAKLEPSKLGIRKLPGTTLKNNRGDIIYTPPQHPDDIVALLNDLERFINQTHDDDLDPLIKMAIVHHRFESIHPFWDGNGRTGRIANVLYLVKEGLLDIPVLYLSRHIMRTKQEYYTALQAVRDRGNWEDWVYYMLTAVEQTARDGITTIKTMRHLLLDTKKRIREQYSFYSQDLLNNLFSHPYTKIAFIQKDLKVSRITATKYLNELVQGGFLVKQKIGRSNYYINQPLYAVLAGESMREGANR